MNTKTALVAGIALSMSLHVALAQTLAPESALQLPRATIVDSDTPPKIMGQAFFRDHRYVTVVFKYGDCAVPLELQIDGNLRGPENTFYTSANCTGTPRVDTNAAKLSVLGGGCELFVVNADNEVFYVDPATAAVAPPATYQSKLTDSDDGCVGASGNFPLVPATTPKIGDLDDISVPPFKIQQ